MTQAFGGHWPILDKILLTGEEYSAIAHDPRAQANLIFSLGNPAHGYWLIDPRHQQEIVARTMRMVPRLSTDPSPRETLEALFKLWLVKEPFEAISRWVKLTSFEPRPLRPEEKVYPTDGWLGMAGAWARECDVPFGYLFWGLVSALSSACRYNFFVDRGTELLRLNHFILLIGERNAGKAAAIDVCLELLSHLNGLVFGWKPGSPVPQLEKGHPFQVKILPDSQESLVNVIRPQEVPLGKFVAESDRTTMMRSPWIVESTGLLALEDLTTFIGDNRRVLATNLQWMSKLFAGKPATYGQGRNRATFYEIAVSLLAGCEPEIFESHIEPLFSHGIVMVYRHPIPTAERRFPTPRARDPLVANTLAKFLLPLTARFSREEMVATPEATDWFDGWYMAEVESDKAAPMSLATRANMVWKFASLLSISDESVPWIHPEHFQQAIRILDHEWQQVKRLVSDDPTEDQQRFDHLERFLFERGAVEPRYLTRTEIVERVRGRKGFEDPLRSAIPLLEDLVKAGRIVKYHNVRSRGARSKRGRGASGYGLKTEVAREIMRRTPSDLRELRALGRPARLHPDDTAAPAPEGAGKAREPEPETETG